MVHNNGRGGRPLEFVPDEAVEAALRLFREKGYAGAAIPDIEQRTGLSRSSLYNSFGSKRDLFAGATDRYQQRFAEEILRPLEEGEGGLADLHALLRRLAEKAGEDDEPPGCLIVNGLVEFGGTDALFLQQAQQHLGRLRDAIGAALRRAAKADEIPRKGQAAKAQQLFGLVLSIEVAARARLPEMPAAALAAAAQTLLCEWAGAARNDPCPCGSGHKYKHCHGGE